MADPQIPDFFPDDPAQQRKPVVGPQPVQSVAAPDFIPDAGPVQPPADAPAEYGSNDWYAQKMGVHHLGDLVPEALTGPLKWAQDKILDPIQQHFTEPLDRFTAARQADIKGVAAGAGAEFFHALKDPLGHENLPDEPRAQQAAIDRLAAERLTSAEAEHPTTMGAVEGAGEMAGGLLDPRMAPLALLGPETAPALRALISMGFSEQMISSAVESVPEIKDAIARGDQRLAASLITKASLSGGLGVLGGLHGLSETRTALEARQGKPTAQAVERDTQAVEGTVLPKQKSLPSADRAALPPATIDGVPIQTFIPPSGDPGSLQGRAQLNLGPWGPNGAPIELPGQLEPQATPYEIPERPPTISLAKQGAAAANPTVPSRLFDPEVNSQDAMSPEDRAALVKKEKLDAQLPEYLRRSAGTLPSEPDTQQPKSDLSEVDRQGMPGEEVDPRTVKMDFESHPFMLEDDVDRAKKNAADGKELTALVHTDETTGEKTVVDGHGSTQAALEMNAPLKITETPNVEGDEAVGLRVASHYAAAEKPEVNASFGDSEQNSHTDDVPTLEAKDAATRQSVKLSRDPRGMAIADAYEAMKHDPANPQVLASYQALINGIRQQWKHVTQVLGISIHPSDDDPYGPNGGGPVGADALFDDIDTNKRLAVWRGGNPLPPDHPLAQIDPETGESYNTMLRAVHDIYGHHGGRNDFSEEGEENAWDLHRKMFEPAAVPALTTETKGQTSWFFHNKEAREGRVGSFAEQKAGVLPDEFQSHPADSWTPQQVLDHVKSGKDYAVLTAENPENKRLSPEENDARNSKMAEDLRAQGYQVVPVDGHNSDVQGFSEHSFFVPGISPEDAAAIGKKYGQASVLTTEGLHDLVKDTVNPSDNKNVITGDEATKQPYYSSVAGQPFNVPLDFDKTVLPGEKNAAPTSPAPAAPISAAPDFIPSPSPFAPPAAADARPPVAPAASDDFTHWRVDTRTGREYPVDDPSTYKPKSREILVQRDSAGRENILAEGKNAFDKLPRQGGLFGNERGSATPDFLSFIATGGLSEVGRKVVEKIRASSDVENWPEVARFLTAEDRNAASKTLQRNIVAAFKKLGDPSLIEEAARAGSISRGWYKRTGEMIRFAFGKDADLMTKFIATTSPMKTVEQNFIDAFKLYGDWVEAGRPKGIEQGRAIRQLLSKQDLGVAGQRTREGLYNILVNGADSTGPKVSNFAKNLRGSFEAVTKDRWMAYLFGNGEKFLKAKGNRLAVDAAVRSVAAKMNMLPAEVQESGWSFIRGVINLSESKGLSPHEAAQQITEGQIKAGSSEFARIISDNPKVRAALDRVAEQTGNDKLRVSTIEGTKKFRDLLAQHERVRGVGGGLGASDRDVLGRAAERAGRARSGETNAATAAGEDDTSFDGGSGGADGVAAKRPTPITDALIQKYGTTDHALGAQFILPDGRRVNVGSDHDNAIASALGQTDYRGANLREGFVNDEGAIRTRFRTDRRGKEVVFSIPEKVSPEQVDQMKRSVQSMGQYGNIVLERAVKGGHYFSREMATPNDIDVGLREMNAHPTPPDEPQWSSAISQFHRAMGEDEGSLNISKLSDITKLPGDLWQKLISPVTKSKLLREKYGQIRDIHDKLAEQLRLRDNVVEASRTIAKDHVKKILAGADRPTERLAFLMSDADSRANLQLNHPAEYQQALNDPNVMGIVNRYRQYDAALTDQRQRLGYSTLPGDYVRRVYDEHIGGGDSSQPYDAAVQFRDLSKKSRYADPEYHYENGRHEFGPAYASKYMTQQIIALDQSIVNEAARTGSVIDKTSKRPPSIQYNGKTYYSPEQAKIVGSKDIYRAFDPERLIKWKNGEKVILAPQKVVDGLSGVGQDVKYTPGRFKTLYQKGTIALGMGIPHAFGNDMRRILSSHEGGGLNPRAWQSAYKVYLDKDLRARSLNPSGDATMRNLIREGSIRLNDEYEGIGSKFLGMGAGHDLIFKPGSWGGLGGIDPRARMEYAERLQISNPNLSWGEIADKVDTQFGSYNQANQPNAAKFLAHVVPFPGWAITSIRQGLEHPLRNKVSAAVTILAINRALNAMGGNREEDKNDISRIHFNDYTVSPTMFREPWSEAADLPISNAVQSMLKGGSTRSAQSEFMRGAVNMPGKMTVAFMPSFMSPLEVAMNRQFAGNEREIYKPGAFDRKGSTKVLSEGTEAVLKHIGLRVIPQIGRAFPEYGHGLDVPGFVSSQFGLTTHKQEASDRLSRDLGVTSHAAMLTSNLSKEDPAKIVKILHDEPDTQVALAYHPAFTKLSEAIRGLDHDKDHLSPQQYNTAHDYLMKQVETVHDQFVSDTKKAMDARDAKAKK